MTWIGPTYCSYCTFHTKKQSHDRWRMWIGTHHISSSKWIVDIIFAIWVIIQLLLLWIYMHIYALEIVLSLSLFKFQILCDKDFVLSCAYMYAQGIWITCHFRQQLLILVSLPNCMLNVDIFNNTFVCSSLIERNQCHDVDLCMPDSKVRAANMGPIWSRQDPGGHHVGPMNFAIWDGLLKYAYKLVYVWKKLVTNLSNGRTGKVLHRKCEFSKKNLQLTVIVHYVIIISQLYSKHVHLIVWALSALSKYTSAYQQTQRDGDIFALHLVFYLIQKCHTYGCMIIGNYVACMNKSS